MAEPPDLTADAQLVAAARAGDREAFAVLAARHRANVAVVCRRELFDQSLAEDAANEAFARAMGSLHTLRDPEAFGPWLTGIGVNVARRWNRYHWREGWSLEAMSGGRRLPDWADPGADVAAAVEARESAVEALEALSELSPGQRAAVALVYLHGSSLAEAALALGTTPGAVKSRLHKARLRLRARSPESQVEGDTMADRVEVHVADVRCQALQPGMPRMYVAVLADRQGERLMPIWLGPNEGIALALLLQKVETPRPLTFAFLSRLMAATQSTVRSVCVDRLTGDTFFATVDITGPAGSAAIDARPSDAIALALASGALITVTGEVFERCGSPVEGWDWQRPKAPGLELSSTEYPVDAEAIAEELRAGWRSKPA